MNGELVKENNIYQNPVTVKNILKFTLPTIAMFIFLSFYTMIDGMFVSNILGTDALSAVNISMPVLSTMYAIASMFATGGSAIVMKKIGEQKNEEAKQNFNSLIIVSIISGVIAGIFGYILTKSVILNMNVSPEVLNFAKEYLGYVLIFTIPTFLNVNFSVYLIASEKANLSFICSIAGGVTNIVLDYLFLSVFNMGIKGAAIATGLGYSVTAVVGLIVFANKTNLLHFLKPKFSLKVLGKTITNGSSEMVNSLSMAITTYVFNLMALKYAGENGVAAITIIMYVLFFVSSLFIGYSLGIAPMISYYFGENNKDKLTKLTNTSLKIIGVISLISVTISIILTNPLVSMFTDSNSPVFQLATSGNKIFSISLLFVGFNIFTSGMFTALNNGFISALLSFTRSLVFIIICLFVFPSLFGITGVWVANPIAEFLSIILSFAMFFKYKSKYNY